MSKTDKKVQPKKEKPVTKSEELQDGADAVKSQVQTMRFEFQKMTNDHRVPRLTRRF